MSFSKFIAVAFSGLLLIAAAGCDTNDPEPPAIEVLSPVAGDTWTVGVEQQVKWKVNSSNVSEVGIVLYAGKSSTEITGGVSLTPDLGVFSYTPTADYVSSSAYIKVYDYADDGVNGRSGIFTIQ